MQNSRRKLIKGALAATAASLAGCGGGGGGGGSGGSEGGASGSSSSAPSTFSLRSPFQASGSAATACIARDAEQARLNNIPTLTDVPQDTYVRGLLEIKEVSENGKVIPGDFFVDGSSRYWQIQGGGSSALPTNFLVGQPGISDTKKGTKQVLLLLDDQGNIVSTALENKGGRLMTTSCHTSVAAFRRA